MTMQRKYRERYATIPIENLKEIIENELFPAALGICNRIRKKGEIEFNKRIKETISKCPLKECVILKGCHYRFKIDPLSAVEN